MEESRGGIALSVGERTREIEMKKYISRCEIYGQRERWVTPSVDGYLASLQSLRVEYVGDR